MRLIFYKFVKIFHNNSSDASKNKYKSQITNTLTSTYHKNKYFNQERLIYPTFLNAQQKYPNSIIHYQSGVTRNSQTEP